MEQRILTDVLELKRRGLNICIFGAGYNGGIIARYLKQNGVKILFFLDNNQKQQHKRKCGKKIYHVSEISKKNTGVIVSVSGHNEEIRKQLIDEGWREEDIIVVEPAEIEKLKNKVYLCIDEDEYYIYHHPLFLERNAVKRTIWEWGKILHYSICKCTLKKQMLDVRNLKYNVTICAIFKNEASYLKEWIEYYKEIGVEHFFLYNNNSTDDYEAVLQPYIIAGEVELILWEREQAQLEAYLDCVDKFSNKAKWIGFIDLDEFVVPIQQKTLPEFLEAFQNWGSVLIPWKVFGSSGLLRRELAGLVIEDFIECWSKHSDTGKCFLNTNFNIVKDKKSFHHFLWTEKNGVQFPPKNIWGKICISEYKLKGEREFPIQINHYVTKSLSEYQNKMKGTDVYFKKNSHTMEMFDFHNDKCVTVDKEIFKYIDALKKRMKEK